MAIEAAGVRANVSIKLTQIGLGISSDLCLENLKLILKKPGAITASCVLIWRIQPLLNGHWTFYIAARQHGYENVGIVIQAYLYRSEEDLRKLLGNCFKIRLCKGAYTESSKSPIQR